MSAAIKNLSAYFRVSEWYDSKIPLAMAVCLYTMLFDEQNCSEQCFLIWYGAYFVFFVCYAAFSYLINDFADMEADYQAGKRKVIMLIDRRVTRSILVVLPTAAVFLLSAASGFKLSVLFMGLFVCFLGMSYSIKGLRMKERGVFGLIAASFAQRNTSILITLSFLHMSAEHFLFWMLLCFTNGLRYILIHQFQDKENDRQTGVHTFLSERDISIGKGVIVSLVLEICSVILLFRQIWKIVVCVGTVYLGVCVLNCVFTRKVLNVSYLYSYASVPMEDLYNVWIPLLLTVAFAICYEAWFLILLTVIYLAVPMAKKVYMPFMSFWKIIHREMG